MWRRMLRKFVKFGRGAREGGFATSAAALSYEITLSILGSHALEGDPIVFCLSEELLIALKAQ